MTMHRRHLRLSGAVGALRSAQFEGRDHLVIPVVALVEGVIWPTGADAPEFVPAELLAKAPMGWNGEPAVMGHPFEGPRPVSANEPQTLERVAFGRLFHASSPDEVLDTRRLTVEAWLDPAAAERCGPEAVDVLRRLEAAARGEGDPVEVSIGAFVSVERRAGVFDGKRYAAVWMELVPDHLAFLSAGATGACSVEAGCGAPRAAVRHLVSPAGITAEVAPDAGGEVTMNRDERVAALIAGGRLTAAATVALRAAAKAGTITDANLDAMEAAVSSLKAGEAVGIVPQVTAAETPQPRRRTLLERFAEIFRPLSAQPRASVNPEDMSDVDLRQAIHAALQASEPGYMGIEAVKPEKNEVVYSAMPTEAWQMFRRTYDLSQDGVVTLNDDRIEVQPVTTFEPVTAAAAEPKAAGCGCGGHGAATRAADDEGATPMATEDIKRRAKALVDNPDTPFTADDAAYLEGLSDERLKAFEAQAAPKTATTTETPAAEQPATAGQSPKAKTAEEWLADAPPEFKDIYATHRAAQVARRTAIVASLKGAQKVYSEAELQNMPLADLEKLAQLAGTAAPMAVDFTGRGTPRAAEGAGEDVYANPPNPYRVALEKQRQAAQ